MANESQGAYNVIFSGDADPLVKAAAQAESAVGKFEKSLKTTSDAMASNATAANKSTFAVQQLAFGLQDAATVFGTTGFAGAVRASSNNLIQFASIIHPMAGTVAAFAGTGLALMVDYFAKTAKEADKASESLKKFDLHARKLEAEHKQQHAVADIGQIDTYQGATEKRRELEQKRDESTNLAVATNREIALLESRMRNVWDKIISEAEERIAYEQGGSGDEFKGALKDNFGKAIQYATEEQKSYIKTIEEEIDALRKLSAAESVKTQGIDQQIEEAKKRQGELHLKQLSKETGNTIEQYDKRIAEDERRANDAIKEAARREQREEEIRKQLTKRAQAHTKPGQVQNVVDDIRDQIGDITKAGFAGDERRRLIDAALSGANEQIRGILSGGAKTTLSAGAADFGSAESISRVASQSMKWEDKMTDELRKMVDIARQQLDALKKDNQVVQVVEF